MPFCRLLLPVLLLLNLRASAEEPGALNRCKEALAKLLPLVLKNDRLVLDQHAWSKQSEGAAKQEVDSGRPSLLVGLDDIGLPVGDHFNTLMTLAGVHGSGSGASNNKHTWHAEGGQLTGEACYDTDTKAFRVRLKELTGGKRTLLVDDDPELGVTLRYLQPAQKTSVVFIQTLNGSATIAITTGEETFACTAPSFAELLRTATNKVQPLFIRKLEELGIVLPPDRWLPTVMAVATTGFTPSPPGLAKQVEEQLVRLASNDLDERDSATQTLSELYPRAIFQISEAVRKTEDAEVKERLARVINAHPGIARARAYVAKEGLHEKREYLLAILASAPFFKAAARVRLTELYGQDHGDDAAAWPQN